MNASLALCSVVTASVLDEFLLMKWSLEQFQHEPFHWHIRSDEASSEALSSIPNVQCTEFCETEPELVPATLPGFLPIVAQKMAVMDDAWSRGSCSAVAFLDADLIALAPFLDLALSLGGDLVLSPNYYPKSAEHIAPLHGYFNSGFILTRSSHFPQIWSDAFRRQPWRFTDQACLNEVAALFDVRMMPPSANVGFWRSAGFGALQFDPLPLHPLFLHVHSLQPLHSRRAWIDRMFCLHCLWFLLTGGNPEHAKVARRIIDGDQFGWYEATLAMSGVKTA